jgi:hypothetical protein
MAALRIAGGFFELWRAKYGGSSVTVYLPGTTVKASLFTNQDLTISASNPQTLQRFTQNGVTYGKLLVPIYVGVAHYCDIDSLEQTGVVRTNLADLNAVDAGLSTAIATGATRARSLSDLFADEIYAEDYGVCSQASSAATNTTTITAAIAAAAATSTNGARVYLPEGTLAFTQLTVPVGVILEGRGNDATTLQSQTGANCITLSGNNCGLARLTLDGVNKVASGVGLFARARKRVIMEDVKVKNFETGIFLQGGRRSNWQRVDVDGCTTGVKWYGDLNASGASDGDEFRQNTWTGGVVSNCTGKGIEVKYVDKKIWNNTLQGIGFESNTGTALHIEGARYIKAPGCYWTSNTTDLVIKDGTPTTKADENTVIDVHFDGGSISGGIVTLQDTLQDVIFDKMELSTIAFTLTLPGNDVVVRDCVENSAVTIAGDGTRFARQRTMLGDFPGSSGLTTGAVATTAWGYKMAAGEVMRVQAIVVGMGRNVIDRITFPWYVSAHRPGGALNYLGQTVNYTVGDIVTGATSGATARIIADADAGATGTLTLKNISKEFVSGEIITGASGGSATTNGTITYSNAVIDSGATLMEGVFRSDATMTVTSIVAADEIQIQVTGAAAKTMEWTVSAQVVSTG